MKNKILKILVFSVLFVFVTLSVNCYAANIEMDLINTTQQNNVESLSNNVESSSNEESRSNVMSNVALNAGDETDLGTSSNIANANVAGNTQQETARTNSASTSTFNSLPESELGLTNILNILLIAVGVVLILLAIAIIIKLKK